MAYPPDAQKALGMLFFIILIICTIFILAIITVVITIVIFRILRWFYRTYLKPRMVAKGWVTG